MNAAWLALAALSLIWGYNWVVMKVCLKVVDPADFAALRTAIGALGLFLVLILQRKTLRPRELPWTLAIGLLSTAGGIGFVSWALTLGAVGKTAMLIYIMPFWVLLLAWPILSERIQGMQWLAVILAFAGLIVLIEPLQMQTTFWGSLLAVLSGLTWAASTIVIKIARRKIEFDLVSLTAWQMLLGAVPLVLIALLTPAPKIQWSFGFIAGLFYSSIISQSVALLLWFYILQELPAGTASLGTLSTPVIGMVAAYIQLGERLSSWEITGTLLILMALAILSIQGLMPAKRIARLTSREPHS